ncbi:DUF192 domain-containing protein [Pseudochrobactrum sp. MP213Fo]|uniref:DUF192 domain-containing protein n=1 Tax=Pseudochrobactrum sp. MP213Fo TaxID=3022250 RepID=UPI003B9E0817
MKQWLGMLVLMSAMIFAAQSALAQNAPMMVEVDAKPLQIYTSAGVQSFVLEVADTEDKRSRGLMHRTDFPSNRAMIFVFAEVQPVMMWMANTPLPLDMLFVRSDGTIARIAANTMPFSKDIVASQVPVAFVIELNAGIAKKLGIKAGDQVQHPVICGKCE